MGAGKIREHFPRLLKRVRDEGKNVVWSCDPMHGNVEKSSTGYKTRDFDNILSEVKQFFEIHKEMGTIGAGIRITSYNVCYTKLLRKYKSDHEIKNDKKKTAHSILH